jgi:hypothetical protein
MSKEEVKGYDPKAMLAKANEEKKVIRYADRVALKVVKATKHYKLGQLISPHPLVAEQLIKNKVAEKVKTE